MALVYATKKLTHYFQAHTVIVLTEHHLQAFLRSADFSRRIAKWGMSLGAFDVKYSLRTSTKGQVLADFMAEFTSSGPNVMSVRRKTPESPKMVPICKHMLMDPPIVKEQGLG